MTPISENMMVVAAQEPEAEDDIRRRSKGPECKTTNDQRLNLYEFSSEDGHHRKAYCNSFGPMVSSHLRRLKVVGGSCSQRQAVSYLMLCLPEYRTQGPAQEPSTCRGEGL